MIWAFGYWVLYPAIPLPGGHTSGLLGWSSRGAVTADLQDLADAARAAWSNQLNNATLQQIDADPKLAEFARAYGRSAFGNNCAPCHGSGGQGSVGYPNLNADRWLWGGTLDQISATITHGARSGDADGHEGNMPAFGRDGILTKAADQRTSPTMCVRCRTRPTDRRFGGQAGLHRQLHRRAMATTPRAIRISARRT